MRNILKIFAIMAALAMGAVGISAAVMPTAQAALTTN
jgi:hypothetical protein